jgi:hypothetical protein
MWFSGATYKSAFSKLHALFKDITYTVFFPLNRYLSWNLYILEFILFYYILQKRFETNLL